MGKEKVLYSVGAELAGYGVVLKRIPANMAELPDCEASSLSTVMREMANAI
jgi:hypothetical protein